MTLSSQPLSPIQGSLNFCKIWEEHYIQENGISVTISTQLVNATKRINPGFSLSGAKDETMLKVEKGRLSESGDMDSFYASEWQP